MTTTNQTQITPFSTLENYPWSTDIDFQSGLTAILGFSPLTSPQNQTTPDHQTTTLALRARCFYYARKFQLAQPIDFEAYSAWRAAQPEGKVSALFVDPAGHGSADGAGIDARAATPASRGANAAAGTSEAQVDVPQGGDATSVLSFQEIMDMIKSDKPIPGIKDIPDTVLTGQGSEASRSRRQKPWERAESAQGSSQFSVQQSTGPT